MRSVKKDLQTSHALEAELNRERAGALGRTGQRLEACLKSCRALCEALQTSVGPTRAALVARYADARAEAEKWRWYLVIQREAMGLRHHAELERVYQTPPIVKE